MFRLLRYAIILATLTAVISSLDLRATSGNIVISQVQTRSLNSSSLSEELVELYNNSDQDIDITNWCLKYGLANNLTESLEPVPKPSSTVKCFNIESSQFLFLPARSYMVLVSSVFSANYPAFGYDFEFKATLSDNNRWLAIYDDSNQIIDLVEWGDADESTTAEGGRAAELPIAGNLIQRIWLSDKDLQDTNNNFDDFTSAPPRDTYFYGSIYELTDICLNIDGFQDVIPEGFGRDSKGNCLLDICPNLDGLQTIIPNGYIKDINNNCVVDICPNLDGSQDAIPDGYELDDEGNCLPDICPNLDGLQKVLPPGFRIDKLGQCFEHDECPNIIGIQTVVPPGYQLDQNKQCVLTLFPLRLTELFPNPIGSDYGNEFIEIFNPTNQIVSLQNYLLSFGIDTVKDYAFPEDSYIEPESYMAVYNSDIKFTLVNTSSRLILKSILGDIISQASIYDNPKEGFSWSLISGTWQYTNQPTPGSNNLVSSIGEVEDDGLEPCAPNQYRNPLTNRCKLLPEYESQLVPCKEGQYRSEETNRCRNIISDVIEYIPCPEGQERNPETNRCRKIQIPIELVPCPEGEERNPKTNRCRKIPIPTTLEPCPAGQERNPETNRCRKIQDVLRDSILGPCPEGQERNPETNRCRKIVDMTEAGYKPEKVEINSDDKTLIIVLSVVGSLALAYGLWEWRSELRDILAKLIKLVRKN